MRKVNKVLLVNIAPNKTGVGNYASLLVKYGELSYDVLNISFFRRGKPDNYPKSRNGKTFFYSPKRNNIYLNYASNYFLLNRHNFNRFLTNIKERYDSIFLDQQELAMMADMFHLKFNCYIHITVHDMGYFKHAPIHPFRFFLNKNLKHLKSKSIKSIMCDSNSTARELAERYPDVSGKISIVELTVDQNRYTIRNKNEARKKLNLPLDKTLVLSVGKDGYIKNVRNFINSIKYIKNDNIAYIRVGKLTYSRNDFDLLLKSLKERIVVVEDVSDNDLPFYYNASDIFVFPSLNEGFGLELVEAHLSGNIIVTTDRAPMNDIVIPGASLLVENPENPAEIAGMIDDASRQYDSMQSILMNAYNAYKNRFSMERFIKRTEEVLQGD
ncbi:MAG: glycosyltransferase [Candidatus Thermoplasmatota archaeon]|nr:glycosyltransferase [Candidatus Thermoplasmatota archaeon]